MWSLYAVDRATKRSGSKRRAASRCSLFARSCGQLWYEQSEAEEGGVAAEGPSGTRCGVPLGNRMTMICNTRPSEAKAQWKSGQHDD